MALFPPAPPHNFTVSNSVILPYPPSQVFSILGAGSNLEVVARLSSAVKDFTLGETVHIPLPEGGVAKSRGNQLSKPLEGGEGVKRTTLRLQESFFVFFGLIESHVRALILGQQTHVVTIPCRLIS
jgi:hypothetical protein